MKKRKIAIVINSRANYGRIKSVLTEIKKASNLELMIIVGASALLYRFGNVKEIIERDGFEITTSVYTIVEGETPTTMAKSTGLAIMELSTIFENLKPDIVLTVADRFETIATAIAASYMNIPVAHTQGGEITGSIDESVRHAVTKLSHIHFPATEKSAELLIKMGELPETVHYTGCPAIDMIADLDLTLPQGFFQKYMGVGEMIDPEKPYIVVLQHPVTTEYGKGLAQIKETLIAVDVIGMQTVWLWPNVDAGSDDISKGLRHHRETNPKSKIHFYRNFSVEDYARLISNSSCLIGNSSSAIREGAYLGVPGVNIGTRQQGREKASNVISVGYNTTEIQQAIESQMQHGKYEQSTLFGDGKAGERIAKILSTSEVKLQKKLSYI